MPRAQVGKTTHKKLIKEAIACNSQIASGLAAILQTSIESPEEIAIKVGRAALSVRNQLATLMRMQALIEGKEVPAADTGGPE
jgi:hypothetical protein